eukprot:TRINITY_DN33541_c0_g1_i1.p1 TRINITY_DN33541_c0_g1~~TRINITY_DN33541_c0_g1_i1.p1  ORF type:complete len:166 (+),score=8.62 TRINITY_DN33541_c0_g1_i1:32-499(+)
MTARHPLTVRVSYRGERLEFQRTPADSVASLTSELSQRTGIESARQRLICSGRVLTNSEQRLSELLARPGASELAMMLIPLEAASSKARRRCSHIQDTVLSWVSFVYAVMYRFFHTLLMPGAYAGKDPRESRERKGAGPDAGDLGRLAAAGLGGG